MPFKTLMDIGSENFDIYFYNELSKISPEARDLLPKDLSFKLFRGGGKVNATTTSRLSGVEKIFILWKCLRKRWYIVIEDQEKGMTPGEYVEWQKRIKKRDYTAERASGLKSNGEFILAGKELSDYFSYLNYLSASRAFNYVAKPKYEWMINKSTEWSKKMRGLVKIFQNYDANKKTWVSQYKIEIPEWYVLISLYDGQEIKPSIIHQENFRRAYQSSPTKIRKSFTVLERKGLVAKTGTGNGMKLRITALGLDLVTTILTKYALEW
jgi:hypothetical protein